MIFADKKYTLFFTGVLFFQITSSQPVITSFTPESGSIGSAVTIAGFGFSATPSDNIVYFGGVKAQVTSSTSTLINIIVPQGATYDPVTVTNGNLVAYSDESFIVTFP